MQVLEREVVSVPATPATLVTCATPATMATMRLIKMILRFSVSSATKLAMVPAVGCVAFFVLLF